MTRNAVLLLGEATGATSTSPVPQRQSFTKLLRGFSKLEHGWDGYEAEPISPVALWRAGVALEDSESLPNDLFPTPRGGVQLEFDVSRDTALEIEILAHTVEYLSVINGHDTEWVSDDPNDIPKSVADFYESVQGG